MANQMTDLRAANDILNLMERSKLGADELFDALPGFLLVLNANGIVLRANRLVGREIGISSDDIPGSHLGDLLGKIFWENFGSQFERLRTGAEPTLEFECPMKSDLGEKKMFWWQITPFSQANKRMPLYFAVGNDITDLRRNHAQVASMEKDLEVTRTVQELLLPSEEDLRFEGLRLVSHYQPVAQSGGDWWWCTHRTDGATEVVIGDVTGHGIGSAMVAAAVSGGYVTARDALMNLSGGTGKASATDELAQLFVTLERNLERMRDYWMTLSALEFVPRKDELHWLSAGAPPLFIQRASGKVERFSSNSAPLASSDENKNHRWSGKAVTTSFSKGDRAMLFTDGIFEFTRENGQEFGLRRLEKLFSESRARGPIEFSREYICEILKKESRGQMSDDGMFVLVERVGS